MSTPIIYSGYEHTGYRQVAGTYKWGRMPDISAVTFHHSAGPRAATKAQAISLHKNFQSQHIAKGYGDIGYHFSLDDHGRFYVLRPRDAIGAHVGGWNTGNIGIMIHGNYMTDQLTAAQHASLRWLFTGGFYMLIGEREDHIRLVRGHKEWPEHGGNLCPGTYLQRRISYLRTYEFH